MKTESVNPRSAADPKKVVLKVDNGKGGFYTFTAEEVEKMKSGILVCTNDHGNARYLKTLIYLATLIPTNEEEKEAKSRNFALYCALTDNGDMPNWYEDDDTVAVSEPQEEHFARINEADGSIIPDGEPIKEDHGYAIPHPMDNEKAAEVCTLEVIIKTDRESSPGRETREFIANGRRIARISPDAYIVGKWCAVMANDITKQMRNASYREALYFVCREIENDALKYGIKVEFWYSNSAAVGSNE